MACTSEGDFAGYGGDFLMQVAAQEGCLMDGDINPLKQQSRNVCKEEAFNINKLKSLFTLQAKDAASMLNVGVTFFKKECRKLGIKNWPYRKMISMYSFRNHVEQAISECQDVAEKEHYADIIKEINHEIKCIRNDSSYRFRETTLRIRQHFYKRR